MKKKKKKTKLSLKKLPDLLKIVEVAEIFRVAEITVKRWVKTGNLDCIRINSRGDMRFLKEVILKKIAKK